MVALQAPIIECTSGGKRGFKLYYNIASQYNNLRSGKYSLRVRLGCNIRQRDIGHIDMSSKDFSH